MLTSGTFGRGRVPWYGVLPVALGLLMLPASPVRAQAASTALTLQMPELVVLYFQRQLRAASGAAAQEWEPDLDVRSIAATGHIQVQTEWVGGTPPRQAPARATTRRPEGTVLRVTAYSL